MSNYLNFHPSTVAEARAFAESLPGGTKTLTLPQRQDSLLLPMPSKPQLQLQPALQPVLMPMPMPMPTPMPMPMPRPQPQSQQSNTSMITDSLATGSPAAGFPITGSTTAAETTVVKTTDATTETAVGYRNNETSPRTPSCGIIPSLQNVVASANVGCRLDLKMIALHARNSEYNPRRMSAVIMRIREPKATGLIFASGKMVVTGAKSENDSRLASRKFARVLQKLGYNAAITEYKLCNLVATCDFQFGVDLARLKAFNPEFGCWEPGMDYSTRCAFLLIRLTVNRAIPWLDLQACET